MAEVSVRPVSLAQTRELRRAVLRPHETLAQLAAAEPQGAFAVGAFVGDELAAVGFVAPDGEVGGWRIRGMAAEPRMRGMGLGTRVLDALLSHARAAGARRIWCNARIPAISLYERAGMRVVSDVFEPPHVGPHVVMEMTLAGVR